MCVCVCVCVCACVIERERERERERKHDWRCSLYMYMYMCIQCTHRCLNQCTYCKTKHARGDLGSYPPEEIISRAKQAFQGDLQCIYTCPHVHVHLCIICFQL